MGTISFRIFAGLTFFFIVFISSDSAGAPFEDFISKISLTSPKSGRALKYDTRDGDLPVLYVDPKDSFQIALTVPKSIVGKAIQIRADDGGVVKGSVEGAYVAIAEGDDGLLKFEYFLGGTIGRYTLKIIAPDYMQVIEFWVGKPRPQASPGPGRAPPSQDNP